MSNRVPRFLRVLRAVRPLRRRTTRRFVTSATLLTMKKVVPTMTNSCTTWKGPTRWIWIQDFSSCNPLISSSIWRICRWRDSCLAKVLWLYGFSERCLIFSVLIKNENLGPSFWRSELFARIFQRGVILEWRFRNVGAPSSKKFESCVW